MGKRKTKTKTAIKIRKEVCAECPFRVKSPPGWLGPNAPELYAEMAVSEHQVPCHMAIDKSDEACRGSIIMANNSCKVPRDPDVAAAYARVGRDQKNFFQWPKDFVDYHRSGSVRSWEKEDDQKKRKKVPVSTRA